MPLLSCKAEAADFCFGRDLVGEEVRGQGVQVFLNRKSCVGALELFEATGYLEGLARPGQGFTYGFDVRLGITKAATYRKARQPIHRSLSRKGGGLG